MIPQTCRIDDLPEYDGLTLVTDRSEAEAVRSRIGPAAADYDSFFVRQGDGEYVEVWGYFGTLPYKNDLAFRVV